MGNIFIRDGDRLIEVLNYLGRAISDLNFEDDDKTFVDKVRGMSGYMDEVEYLEPVRNSDLIEDVWRYTNFIREVRNDNPSKVENEIAHITNAKGLMLEELELKINGKIARLNEFMVNYHGGSFQY